METLNRTTPALYTEVERKSTGWSHGVPVNNSSDREGTPELNSITEIVCDLRVSGDPDKGYKDEGSQSNQTDRRCGLCSTTQ